MIITKFLFLLSFFVLLVGPTMASSKEDRPCTSPNLPQSQPCKYAILVTKETIGGKPPKGIVPPAIVEDNLKYQHENGNKDANYDNYPYDDEYSIPVPKEDFSKFKKGKYYIVVADPRPDNVFDARVYFIKEITLDELKKELQDNHYGP